MKIQFGLFQTKNTADKPVRCADPNCLRSVEPDGLCFIDIDNSSMLCNECGQCERYSRKKQQEREKAGISETPLIKGLDY